MSSLRKLGSLSWKIGLAYLGLILFAAIIIGILLMLSVPFIVSALIAIIISAILVYFISGKVSERIDYVTKQAEMMLDGDFSKEIHIDTNDEIGELGRVFNDLRIELDKNLIEATNEKNKMETILKHMADGVLVVNFDGKIVHSNPSARTMLRINEGDINRKSYDDIIAKYDDDLILNNLLEATAEEAAERELIYGGATYSVRIDRFQNDENEIMGVIIILQDVTERLKVENMQTDFVANVSHELKTPLTTVKSYTETLLEGGLEDKETTREFLKIIDSEADRMNRLVRDLLQLSRLNYKQQKWYKREADLISLVKTAIKKMDMTAKSKEQQVNILFDDTMPIMVDMDRDRIEQVFMNVLSNAIKYTKKNGRIDIDIIKGDKIVDIVISDNGIGIPEKQLARVFERFFRVDKARSRSMGGTGLGLSISKQIIEEHKGDISIESKLGRGTKVTISLPLAPMRGKPNIL